MHSVRLPRPLPVDLPALTRSPTITPTPVMPVAPDAFGSQPIAALPKPAEQTRPAPGLTAAARELQLSPVELNELLVTGMSLTEVAQRRGISPDAVTYAVRNELATARPDLSSGELTQFAEGLMSRRSDPLLSPALKAAEGSDPNRPAPGLDAAARQLQLTVDELKATLAQGVTLTEVAARRGVSADDVACAVRGELESTHPKLTGAQVDLLARGLMTRRADPLAPKPGAQPARQPALGMTAAARELQLSTEALDAVLRTGATLAEIAKRRGISVDAVTDAVRREVGEARTNLSSGEKNLLTEGLMNRRLDPLVALQRDLPAIRFRPFISP